MKNILHLRRYCKIDPEFVLISQNRSFIEQYLINHV